MIKNKIIQACICTIVATITALTSHILLSRWLNPILEKMMQTEAERGVAMPDASTYPIIIMILAYFTAFIMVAGLVFCYYYAQHLIPGRSKPLKVLCVTAILFVIKGDLMRQAIMDVALNYVTDFNNPVLFVVLNHMDKWVATLLLAASLVYLCPERK